MKKLISQPLKDYQNALSAAFSKFSYLNLIVLITSAVVSWWLYVPVHELFHAFGCLITGGEVTDLAISRNYGAEFLKELFPFVTVGSEYAGQLKGFDTHGNDLIYLATDFFPYLLTIFIGIPLLKSAFYSKPFTASFKLGISMPVAFAPFISIAGDYYEMGSIVISRIFTTISPEFVVDRFRSDDFFKLSNELLVKGSQTAEFPDYSGISLSLILGILLAFLTYFAGHIFSKTFQ